MLSVSSISFFGNDHLLLVMIGNSFEHKTSDVTGFSFYNKCILQMDEEERYNRKLESGLYTLQVK